MADTKNTWPRLRSLQRRNILAVLLLIPGTIFSAFVPYLLFGIKSDFHLPLVSIPWMLFYLWTMADLHKLKCPACGFQFVNTKLFFTQGSFWAKKCTHCGASEIGSR